VAHGTSDETGWLLKPTDTVGFASNHFNDIAPEVTAKLQAAGRIAPSFAELSALALVG
jgi:hypothetical protein